MKIKKLIFNVKKFRLDDEAELEEYTAILNDSKITITRDAFTYDKIGRPLITIWYTVEKQKEIVE